MDLKTFTQMFSDKYSLNLTKLKYKYGKENLSDYIGALNETFFTVLPLKDFNQENIVFIPSKVNLTTQSAKSLLQDYSKDKYGISAMEEEIIATLSIEQIKSSRDSVRNILNGGAPVNEDEDKVYGIKRGLDFIADPSNKITVENLYKLYMLSVGDFLEDEDKLLPGNRYRHDNVYIVGGNVSYKGLPHKLLPQYIETLIDFINNDDNADDIIKSIVAHYYLAYLHPYFDGNGRTARLLQMWVLVQKGYTSSLFIPYSAYIDESKGQYYNSFTTISDNYKLSNILDITPFIDYMVNNVFTKINNKKTNNYVLERFKDLLANGEITEKEKSLFYFVLSAYGNNEFSTKQLEKDYRDVAYATVRAFVLKFEGKGLLSTQKYSNKVKYKIRSHGDG